MEKIIGWLTSDCSTGVAPCGTSTTTPETFHFALPWLIFCVLGLLTWFYYTREGRKRFFGGHTLNKALLDKFTAYLWPLCLVGLILLGTRVAGMAVFGLRLWRYLWALWAVGLFGYWAYYLATKYRQHLAAHNWQRTQERYIPQPKPKPRQRRTARV